jgi:hypothetical protein
MIMAETRIRNGNWMIAALALLFGLIVFGQLFAENQAKPAESSATPTAPALSSAVKEQQDSLYARIDDDFRLIEPIIQKSCFDCHSSSTHYPWYHKIPIIKGMIDGDIKKGRSHVDFSDGFPFKTRHEILDILQSIKDEVSSGDMPPWNYRLIHWGTAVEGVQKDSVISWVDSTTARIEQFFDKNGITYKKPDTTSSGDDED